MKSFSVQIEEIRQSISVRLENYRDAMEKYHSEHARLLEQYFNEGFRADVAEKKAKEETDKIKHKAEAISKELDKIFTVLSNIDPGKIKEEKRRIEGKYHDKEIILDKDRKRGKGVLIVDDAAFMRTLIRETLTTGGITVAGEADNGKVAFEKYKELLPELVILDIRMPESDGFDALENIKNFDSDAKVIMCSQVNQQATVDKAIKLGAINFIAKPFKPDVFLGIVKKILGKK
jgi:two-component system chemotaxis response regulator CheY